MSAFDPGSHRKLRHSTVTTRLATPGERVSRAHRFAWLTAAAAVLVAGNVAPVLVDAGWRLALVGGLSFYLGLVAGCAWQVLNRREFVDRFFNWSLILAIIMLLSLLSSGGGDRAIGAWSFAGVVAGVVLAEGWMRQKHRP
jgi:hypothetical protein